MKVVIVSMLFCFFYWPMVAQSGNVGIGTSAPNNSAQLDIVSSDKGFLMPRLTLSQRNSIVSPASGLMIYQTDNTPGFYFYDGSTWSPVAGNGNSSTQLSGIINTIPKFVGSNLPVNSGNNLIVNSLSSTRMSEFYSTSQSGIAVNAQPTGAYGIYAYRRHDEGMPKGQTAIMGYSDRAGYSINGNSYAMNGSFTGVTGFSKWGDLYTFGVGGWNNNDNTRTGGVIGAEKTGLYWGALGYKASNSTTYGIYATATPANGTGYLEKNIQSGIGLGSYGGLMGGWSRGEVLGFASNGDIFASYNIGNEFTSGFQADIIQGQHGREIVYGDSSTTLRIHDDGYAEMVGVELKVLYSDKMLNVMDQNQRPVICVTPIGSPASIYIKNMDKSGFTVARSEVEENGIIEFSWIVSAKRTDLDHKYDKVLEDSNFDSCLKGLMSNENNTERSASEIIWDGKGLKFLKH